MTTQTASSPRIYTHLIGTDETRSDADPVRRIDPAHGGVIAEWEHAGTREVDAAVGAARAAFDGGWPRLPRAERAASLRALAGAVDGQRDRLAQLDSQEV